MRRFRLDLGTFLILSAILVSCGTSSEPHFYTLSAVEQVSRDRNDKVVERSRIVVGPVTLPEIVDRPELVVRIGANEVALAEQHRWAQPLRNEIARVIVENLQILLGGNQVVTYPYNASREADYRVFLDIQRFESILGQTVMIDTLWAIRQGSGGREVAVSERSITRESTDGNGYEALVVAHARALARISAEIADAIRKTTAKHN